MTITGDGFSLQTKYPEEMRKLLIRPTCVPGHVKGWLVSHFDRFYRGQYIGRSRSDKMGLDSEFGVFNWRRIHSTLQMYPNSW